MAADDQRSEHMVSAVAPAPVSVLWLDPAGPDDEVGQPACFVDLNLDQIVKEVLAGFETYELLPVFWRALSSADAVRYRQAVMADIALADVHAAIRSFASTMGRVRWATTRADKFYDERQQQRWFLDAAERYAAGVRSLLQVLLAAPIASSGLCSLRDYLAAYVGSAEFIALTAEVERLVGALKAIRYKVHIRGLRVDLETDQGEADYSQAVLQTFDRFRQGDGVRDFSFDMADSPEMNHVEASILEQLARMHPELFADLARFRQARAGFQDACVLRFDREIQFYIAYTDYIAPLRAMGLAFCVPQVIGPDEALEGRGVFDIALARKLRADKQSPVANDFELSGPERILVVSGPNQGGKTTFARAFGQVHWLANLGLPVPGERAALRQFDHLFTHFERGENTADLRGKLADDLVRVHQMLGAASARTVIIFNEMFTSTTFRDALVLSKAIMRKLVDNGLTAVWVTFIDELASWNEHTVSMVSNVDPTDLTRRTFKVVRRPADGLAYALSIAEKWGVTLPQLRERLSR